MYYEVHEAQASVLNQVVTLGGSGSLFNWYVYSSNGILLEQGTEDTEDEAEQAAQDYINDHEGDEDEGDSDDE
ncbi:MAG: hypothetical protein JSS27_13625 [Planctomycetes bacterium]|nr:hypothetical protein [Planctomycetota bacterium]